MSYNGDGQVNSDTPPNAFGVAEGIEAALEAVITIVTFLSHPKLSAAAIAVSAELATDMVLAQAFAEMLHKQHDSGDPLDCVTIEKVQRKALVCFAWIATMNLAEMKKAYTLIRAVKTKVCGCCPTRNLEFTCISKKVHETINKIFELVFAITGTATRALGSFSSVVNSVSLVVGAYASSPKPCMREPWWGWLLASIVLLLTGAYKPLWLTGYNPGDTILKFLTGAYALFRNTPIFMDNIVKMLLVILQTKTEGGNFLENPMEQGLWLVVIIMTGFVYVRSQFGLNHYDARSSDYEPVEEPSQKRKIFDHAMALVGGAGIGALTAKALKPLAKIGEYDMPAEPAPYDQTLLWVLYICVGAIVGLYYTNRFLLGLSNY